MSDLIERLKEVRDLWESPNDPPEWDRPIQEAIAALSPVLPDELLHMLDRLRAQPQYAETVEAADLLERQARNYESACRLMEMKDDDRDKLQQRIEDLETALTSAGDSYEVLGKLCIEAQAQVKDAEKAYEGCAEGRQNMVEWNTKLQAQVKELEASLTEVIEAQHSGFIDNCSDETQRLYTKMNNRQVTI